MFSQDGSEVGSGGPHVQEHGQPRLVRERKLQGKTALLRVLVAELQAVIVEAALPHSDHLPTRLASLDDLQVYRRYLGTLGGPSVAS